MQEEINDVQDDDNLINHVDQETKEKIDRHLKERGDTISEEDISKVKTDIKSEDIPDNNKPESDLIEDSKDEDKNYEHPKKEMPNSWDMMDETT
ncbi:MAG: hypothetical protein H0W12_06395 [Chitinophagaceae bacterium]|nr:hypothetical protein [Chitinophagaceae bacterium]